MVNYAGSESHFIAGASNLRGLQSGQINPIYWALGSLLTAPGHGCESERRLMRLPARRTFRRSTCRIPDSDWLQRRARARVKRRLDRR